MGHSTTKSALEATQIGRSLAALARRPLSLFLLLFTVTLLTRMAYFVVPHLGHDEPTYAAMATRYLHGGLPYLDAVDHKPAGISVTYALIFALCGEYNLLAVRIVFVAVIALCGLLLAQLGKRLLGDKRGWVAGLVYVLYSCVGIGSHHYPPDTELFLNLPLTAAALLVQTSLDRSSRDRSHGLLLLVAAGFLTGLAGAYKYQGAVAGAAWAMALLFNQRRVPQPWGIVTLRLASLVVGFALFTTLYLGYFVYHGIWSEFLFWGWGFNQHYLSTIEAKESAWLALRALLVVGGSWLPLLLCFVVPSEKRLPGFVWVWLGLMLAVCGLGGRFFFSYFLMALPPLSLLMLPGFLALLDGQRGRIPHQLAVSVALTLLLCTAFAIVAIRWASITPNGRREQTAAQAVGTYIRSHSTPEDRIFVWGAAPEIYSFSHRVIGTRFVFCNYHTGKIWGGHLTDVDATDTDSHIIPRAWEQLMQDLQQHPPLFVVDSAAGRFDRFDRHPISRYPKLAALIGSRYDLVAVVSGVPIYRRHHGDVAQPSP